MGKIKPSGLPSLIESERAQRLAFDRPQTRRHVARYLDCTVGLTGPSVARELLDLPAFARPRTGRAFFCSGYQMSAQVFLFLTVWLRMHAVGRVGSAEGGSRELDNAGSLPPIGTAAAVASP